MTRAIDSGDIYDREWSAQDYLRQYYSTSHLPEDVRVLLTFFTEQLAESAGKYRRALEFGCGPTVYTASAIAPFVEELHLADYVPDNLREVRRWLDEDPGAHDWGRYLDWISELQDGDAPSAGRVAERAAALRRTVVGLHQADLRRECPLGLPMTFDLVVSCFCIEAIGQDRDDWQRYLGNLASMVGGGGRLLLAAMRRCSAYEVLGKSFPATPVDEDDFVRVLPGLGFDPGRLVVRAVPIAEWAAEGFDSICLVSGIRS